MKDKAFDLLTTLYSEINERFDKVDNDIFEVRNQVLKTDVRIENILVPKIEALFDGYKQNAEQLSRIEDALRLHCIEDVVVVVKHGEGFKSA